jgi:endonuclease YncB( thermonuclease family)
MTGTRRYLMLETWMATAALAAAMPATAATTLEGKVRRVSDGDTVVLVVGGRDEYRIRLAHIDAPEVAHKEGEKDQPYGPQSGDSLSELVLRKQVTAVCNGADHIGRPICDIYIGTLHVNAEQVRRGYAMVYKRYEPQGSPLYAVEEAARRRQIGLWVDPNPIPPWEWRRKAKR